MWSPQQERLENKVREGFLIIDKPPNLLSHEVSAIIGRLFSTKAGHGGTLDPKVSGVLVVALGRSARLLRFLTEMPKTYVGIVEFKEKKNKEGVERLFSSLTGVIEQLPPKEAAVARRRRKRMVYSLELLELSEDGKFALFKARVEKGTYIRVLCEDMGGSMVDLRRVETAGIEEKDAVIMQKVVDAKLLHDRGDSKLLDSILLGAGEIFWKSSLAKVVVNNKAAKNMARGAPLYAPGIMEVFGNIRNGLPIAVYSVGGSFIGVWRAVKDYKKESRGTVAKAERVHLNLLS
ncbi:MAG: RNA-guided pseudouridylation complex pseudouridine synthase subunit Cbf5 [Methanobacteriota archaeon]|nr:MAG: RNA-guided pseudouridylation complex pseudouridine synthase subunit Cbf5 [Euryarchaeota archaeon]